MKSNRPISRVLIANRSEVALRVINTCKTLGIQTVCIYAPEDQHFSYLYQADAAYPLSKNGSEAYLAQEEIIAIALKAHADAVHPGYGFLSENASFAEKVIKAGLTWIGPHPRSIALMGDKNQARQLMHAAGVPTIPGHHFDAALPEASKEGKTFALSIGFPIIIKSANGGGGKAMRKVEHPDEFEATWLRCRSESEKYFKSSILIIEKYLAAGRHIEVQIAGDGKNYIHLYERECSIQRRHQKIIEETPCRFIPQNILDQLYQAALNAARSVGYDNVGTAEFMVTNENSFYFLEMNTRLQVEHSITEMTTGVDLVALQIEIAATKKLSFTQATISRHGHAIECRIYAEDPTKNFMPATGTIHILNFPSTPFVRYDQTLEQGTIISPLFDPMIAKVTTFGATRLQAKNHMIHVLKTMIIQGVVTNISLLAAILEHADFANGQCTTQWLSAVINDLINEQPNEHVESTRIALLAAACMQSEYGVTDIQPDHTIFALRNTPASHHLSLTNTLLNKKHEPLVKTNTSRCTADAHPHQRNLTAWKSQTWK